MGSKTENLDLLRSYILKLTDQDIDVLEEISLSSGQKARVAAWCEEKGIETPDLSDNAFWKNSINSKRDDIPKKAIDSKHYGNLSLGVDIQEIAEFFPDIEIFAKSEEELLKIFTKNELSYAESKPDTRQTLAGIFAAKEAIFKCGEVQKRRWSDIELKYNGGKPEYSGYVISISHSGAYAIATAIKEMGVVGQITIESGLKNQDNVNNVKKNISKRLYEYILLLGSIGGLVFIVNFIFKYFL